MRRLTTALALALPAALVLLGTAAARANSIATAGGMLQRAAHAHLGQIIPNDFVVRERPSGASAADWAYLEGWRNRGYRDYVTTSSALHALGAVRQLVNAGYAGRIQLVGVRITAGFDRHVNYYVLYLPR